MVVFEKVVHGNLKDVIPGNSTCITLLFQDNKDGDIKIAALSAGDEYGILGMDLGMGTRTVQACEEKLKSMDENG